MNNAHEDHDFRQLAGKFHDPIAPSPTFATNLRQRLAMTPDNAPPMIQPVPSGSISQPVANTERVESMSEAPWRPARWMRTLEAAVAAVLVMSLAGASVLFRQPAALYDLAFQPAQETSLTEVNYGGNAGRTWVVDNVEPEMGGFRMDPAIDLSGGGFDAPQTSAIIVGGSYVFTVSGLEEDQLVRYELDSHERAWASSMYVTGRLASDGERIFGMRSDRMTTTDAATLVAIDFETGEIAWEGPELANRFAVSSSLVVSGDTVFVTDYLGNTVAVDTAVGTLLWQYPETFAVPAADEDLVPQTFFAGPEIAANDTAVFLNRPSKAILSLDRDTGDELGSINLIDAFGPDIVTSLVQVQDQRLAITAIRASRSSADPEAIRDYTPGTLLVLDAQSLTLQTRTEIPDFRGNPVLAPDAIYVPAAASVDDHASLHRVDLVTGDLSEPLEGVSDRWDMTLSASGNVLMATGDPSTIAFFDLDSGKLLDSVELGITNMETPFGQPVQMWGDSPIVITGLGEVYVIVDDPAR